MMRFRMIAAAALSAAVALVGAGGAEAVTTPGKVRPGQYVTTASTSTANYKVEHYTTDYHRAKFVKGSTTICVIDQKVTGATATASYKIKGTSVLLYTISCSSPLPSAVRWV